MGKQRYRHDRGADSLSHNFDISNVSLSLASTYVQKMVKYVVCTLQLSRKFKHNQKIMLTYTVSVDETNINLHLEPVFPTRFVVFTV